MERLAYKGWPNCVRLSNAVVDLVATTAVGPRIMRFGFLGQENEFMEVEETLGLQGGEQWRMYGGHRFWYAPESVDRTYLPDNSPVKVDVQGKVVRLTQPVEALTGIQKEIDIELSPRLAQATLTHRLRNCGRAPVELAPWALSVMAPSGRCIVPLPPRGSHPEHLTPSSTLTLWAYTDLADPRWTWGRKYVMLRQDPSLKKPQKLGFLDMDGWAAYARQGHLFVKTFPHQPNARYPDMGSSVEVFTNEAMLEVESLGPLVSLAPGESVEHREAWHLFGDVPEPLQEDEVERHVLPCVRGI